SGAGQNRMGTRESFAASPLLAGGEDAREDAVKLFDRKVLAHVTVRSGTQCGMHSFLVISDAGKNNDREALAHFPDESDEGEAIDLGHIEIDHDNVALVMLEPGGGLKTFREVFAGVTLLFEVSDEKFRDGRVIVDEKEFNGIAWQDFHGWPSVIITIPSISTNLAKCPSSVFFSPKAVRSIDSEHKLLRLHQRTEQPARAAAENPSSA